MNNSFFDLDIPEHVSTRDLIRNYCMLDINNKNLNTIFQELQKSYGERRRNLQPTYAQFSSYRQFLRYQHFKKKILVLPHWLDEEIVYWNENETFKKK